MCCNRWNEFRNISFSKNNFVFKKKETNLPYWKISQADQWMGLLLQVFWDIQIESRWKKEKKKTSQEKKKNLTQKYLLDKSFTHDSNQKYFSTKLNPDRPQLWLFLS